MESIYPIDEQIINVVRTMNSGFLQTYKYLGLTPYRIIKNTTLNEKFAILPEVAPAGDQMPSNRYLVIGNRGHRNIKGEDGSDESENIIHRTDNCALYNHIPFVMRAMDDDLTALQREQYCLRRIEAHFGKNYIVYYARRFDVALVRPQLIEIEVINGIPTPTPYVPTSDNLNPEIPEISNNGTVIGSNKNISSSAIVEIRLSSQDVYEIVNAHRIRTNSTRSPVISEMGICSGVDRTADGTSDEGVFQYREVIACQINTFIASNHPIGYNNSGLTLRLDIGNTEPTLGQQAVHQAVFVP